MHDGSLSTIERALQMAKGGAHPSVRSIRAALKQEGYQGVDEHISGSAVKKQLSAFIKAARS